LKSENGAALRACRAALFLLSFLTVSASGAGENVFVTGASREGDRGSVVLNGSLEISDILFVRGRGRPSLRFPEYTAKSGRAYPQVVVHSKKLYDEILAALDGAPLPTLPATPLPFRAGEPSLLRGSKRKANVDVTFGGAVTVVLGVMEGRGGDFWVGYPGRPGGDGKRRTQARLLDKNLKRDVEAAVLRKFRRMLSETAEDRPGKRMAHGD
jgi:DNA-binding cell septation regulator SpoVG